ncbi:hypothetical protein [Mucilaginibacter polytrichastri]|uniref:Uncharacterized protein n=1 Tax=Mucilaginibacter polytrichastri TaxID=1302689 RepID=A0A1Q5ZVW2_9SPHI|nr:hypothetical protein [Mucilaginibacter polytrichastri]OKS85890.1 hypothetical protein RG47T_1336 [Mucilaginibacter polytrichastri]
MFISFVAGNYIKFSCLTALGKSNSLISGANWRVATGGEAGGGRVTRSIAGGLLPLAGTGGLLCSPAVFTPVKLLTPTPSFTQATVAIITFERQPE